jgi:hypothetical protein
MMAPIADTDPQATSRNPLRWLFSAPGEPITPLRIVGWWEVRRIPYNVFIGVVGYMSFVIASISAYSTGLLGPMDEMFHPFVLLMVPIAGNLCYTGGWVVEVALRRLRPSLTRRFGPELLKAGLWISLFVLALPVIYWGGFRILQKTNVVSPPAFFEQARERESPE